jgi:putative RNA 2'-phosphotransferase
MDDKRLVKVSKYLSKHLRHAPGRIGLQLESGGWVAIDAFLSACASYHFAISRDELNEVVRRSDKQRFAINEASTHIRANQGHSVEVDLELPVAVPPAVLFHGTARQNIEAIAREGLNRGRRHHVHLSCDRETARRVGARRVGARRVGARHGTPVIFRVDAARMHAAGKVFFVSENGVWLCEEVAPQYLELED